MIRPAPIIWFERLYLAGLLISAFYMGPILRAAGSGSISPLFLIGIVAFGFGLPLLLTLLVSRRRNNIAKWLLVGLFGLAVALTVYGQMDSSDWGWSASGLAIWALQAVAIALLFAPSSRAWLGNKGIPQAQLHSTFD